MRNIFEVEEETIYVIMGIFLLFALINFDPQVGIIFFSMTVLDWLMHISYHSVFPTIRRGTNWVAATAAAVILYFGFAYGMSIVQKFNSLGSVMSSWYETMATTPALANNIPLLVATFGILIPIIETRFFCGAILEWISRKMHNGKTFSLTSGATWSSVLVTSGIATLYHLTAKGVISNILLFQVFCFFTLSCFMVLYFKELQQAIGLHIASNTLAILKQVGWLMASWL